MPGVFRIPLDIKKDRLNLVVKILFKEGITKETRKGDQTKRKDDFIII